MKYMKKLNRKGFTLIELLAIIVILAIIMVVTIPSILSTMGSATSTEFQNSADAIEKWVSDEYILSVTGTVDNVFSAVCAGPTFCNNAATTVDVTTDAGKAFLRAAGQVPENYSFVSVHVDKNTNRVCVKIKPSSTGSFKSLYSDTVAETASHGCA